MTRGEHLGGRVLAHPGAEVQEERREARHDVRGKVKSAERHMDAIQAPTIPCASGRSRLLQAPPQHGGNCGEHRESVFAIPFDLCRILIGVLRCSRDVLEGSSHLGVSFGLAHRSAEFRTSLPISLAGGQFDSLQDISTGRYGHAPITPRHGFLGLFEHFDCGSEFGPVLLVRDGDFDKQYSTVSNLPEYLNPRTLVHTVLQLLSDLAELPLVQHPSSQGKGELEISALSQFLEGLYASLFKMHLHRNLRRPSVLRRFNVERRLSREKTTYESWFASPTLNREISTQVH
jgi:hypothetical protein